MIAAPEHSDAVFICTYEKSSARLTTGCFMNRKIMFYLNSDLFFS